MNTLASTFSDKTSKCATNWFIPAQIMQILEFLYLKYVTYTQLI